MFPVLKKINSRSAKIIIALLLVVLLALPPFVNVFVLKANAGTPSPAKVTINNSQAGATGVTYSVDFTATASTAIQRLTIQFCQTASGTCTEPAGMHTTSAVMSSNNVSGSAESDTFSGDGLLRSDWTASTQSPLAVHYVVSGITNPTTINNTSYTRITTYSDAGTTVIDSATVAFAVLNTGSIAVTATVDPNFTFTVTRAVTGAVDGGSGEPINVSSTTDSSIPFGSLNTQTASVAAHDITITTNATNGYLVTASHSATTADNVTLTSGSNVINSFTGTNAIPASWSDPTGAANSNSGLFAYTTNNSTPCTGTTNRFVTSGPKYAGLTATGAEVACSTTSVNSETTRVGWKLGIDTRQPAGGYTGTIILVATPTY